MSISLWYLESRAAHHVDGECGESRSLRRLASADAETIGIIYDEIDGLNFYNEYGMLRDLFADSALAADKRYSRALQGYGEALLRRRKPWYYEREPRPGISVIGGRLSELADRR